MPNLPNFRRQAMGDVVPAMLEPGEFVINRKAVNALGVDNLEVLNDAGGAHSAIDELIASATVANSLQNAKPPHFQEGGQVRDYIIPAGKNIFGKPTDSMTTEELFEMIMPTGGIGGGMKLLSRGAKAAPSMGKNISSLFGKGDVSVDRVAKYFENLLGYNRNLYKTSKIIQPEKGWGYIEELGKQSTTIPKIQKHLGKSGDKKKLNKAIEGFLKEAEEANKYYYGYQEGGEVGMGLENFISRIAGEREDVTRAGIRDIMNRVAFHESAGTMDPSLIQKSNVYDEEGEIVGSKEGPGRGVYQFERGAGQGGATAGNRLANQLKIYKMKVPKWLKSFNKSGKGDVSKLPREHQDMLFIGNMMQHPQANMGEVISEEMDLADFWQKYHQAGGEGVRDARMASFEKSMGKYPGMQQGGQVEQLEYREPPVQGNGLMGMSNDRRVMPVLPPDEYVMRQENGEMLMSKQQVPKLSPAYMASFGMETPLSKRQRSLLQRRAINPESMSPQLHGLLGKVLLQRLENEPE